MVHENSTLVDCLHVVNRATVNLYASSVAYPELYVTLHHVALACHLTQGGNLSNVGWTTSLQLNLKVFLVCIGTTILSIQVEPVCSCCIQTVSSWWHLANVCVITCNCWATDHKSLHLALIASFVWSFLMVSLDSYTIIPAHFDTACRLFLAMSKHCLFCDFFNCIYSIHPQGIG